MLGRIRGQQQRVGGSGGEPFAVELGDERRQRTQAPRVGTGGEDWRLPSCRSRL
jgi:hypothetical protein